MRHRTSPRFWKAYGGLPDEVQRLADAHYELLKADASHPSLNLEKAGRFGPVRVGLQYRALAVRDGDDLIWLWIGHHSAYDRLIA